jgi:hypothetical protein
MNMTSDSTAFGAREPIVESSPHAASGFVTCAQNGCICWRGAIERLPADAFFDAIYCHDDDAERIRRALLARHGRTAKR